MSYAAFAIAPGVAISLYFFYKDLYNREPAKNLLISFIIGGLAILPARELEIFFAPGVIDGTVLGVAVFAYLVVGLSEEACKFAGLRLYSYNTRSFDEPLDGIIYSVMVGMGFATVENVMYVQKYAAIGMGWEVGLQRMFLSVPAHATFAVVMGYFTGKAKFAQSAMRQWLLLLTGLALATFFHGTYDFFLFLHQFSFVGREIAECLLLGGAIVSLIVALFLSRKMLRHQRSLSEQVFKDKNRTISV